MALQHRVVLINKPLSNYNEDVDATYRGTHRLHNPERHMLWHLDSLPATTDRSLAVLLDRLKAYSLWPYYLSHKYHAATMPLLEGVDWKNVPGATCRRYRLPLWYARVRECVLMQAVRIKDCLMRARSNHNEFHPISR